MKNFKSKKGSLLLPTGILLVSGITILSRFISLPDYIKGIFVGVGIGLMLIYLIIDKPKRQTQA
jgi:hypothetical protein